MLHYRGKDLADRPTHLRTHGHSTDGHHAGKDTQGQNFKGMLDGHKDTPPVRSTGEGDEDRRTDTHGQTWEWIKDSPTERHGQRQADEDIRANSRTRTDRKTRTKSVTDIQGGFWRTHGRTLTRTRTGRQGQRGQPAPSHAPRHATMLKHSK